MPVFKNMFWALGHIHKIHLILHEEILQVLLHNKDTEENTRFCKTGALSNKQAEKKDFLLSMEISNRCVLLYFFKYSLPFSHLISE